MSKASKNKNGKVPKITEAEYAAYLATLKTAEENQPPRVDKTLIPPISDCKNDEQG